jgi:hypothetical protein
MHPPEGGGWHVEVLHHARQVAEADVDELHVLVLEVLHDLVGVAEHPTSTNWERAGVAAGRTSVDPPRIVWRR